MTAPAPTYDLSSVGLYILDILGRPVREVPERGGVTFIDEIRLTVAGPAGGTAIDAAKLGLKTLAVGAVGRDEKGDFIRATLERHGVDGSGLLTVDGVPTSATILPIRPNGERPALHNRGANDHFLPGPDLVARALDARFVHVGGTGLLAAFDGAPTLDFLRRAKAAGRTTTFDLIAITEETRAIVEPLLPHVDYFIPSIEEAAVLSGSRDPYEAARFLLDRGVGTAVITLGEDGSVVVPSHGPAFHQPAYAVDVRDTTGCGDAYTAGFIAALARDFDLAAAARFASAAAGLVATGLGSDAGIVSFADTLALSGRLALRAA